MKRNNKKGFTIVELVIVIAVIAILSAVLIPTFGGMIERANESSRDQEARNALTNYMITVSAEDLEGGVDGIIYIDGSIYNVADNNIEGLTGAEAEAEMRKFILNKEKDLKTSKVSLGTTPRRITDLVGSLCDLVSGSGDKGTPIVLITGYFDNYATE